MKIPRWLGIFGTIDLVLFTIFLGFIWLMPRASLGRIAEAQLQKATAFRYDVNIAGASFTPFGTIKATDIHLKSKYRVSENLIPGQVNIDKLKVRAGILSLIRRKPSIKTIVDFPSGTAKILVRQSKQEKHLELQFFDVSLDDLGIVRDYARVPLRGTLRGSLDGTVGENNELADASIDMNILNFIVGPRTLSASDMPPSVQQYFFGDMTIPSLHAGDMLIRGETKDDGAFVIDEWVGQGKDIRMQVDGQLNPAVPFAQSKAALKLSVALDPTWVEKAELDVILDNVPMISRAQQEDSLVFSVTGPLNQIQFQPASGGRRLR